MPPAIPRPYNPFVAYDMAMQQQAADDGMLQMMLKPGPIAPPVADASALSAMLAQQPQQRPQQPAPMMPMLGAAPPAPTGGGFMGNLKGGVKDFLGSDAALAFAAGALGGGSTGEAFGRGLGYAMQARAPEQEARRETAQRNQTAEYFERAGRPDLAEMTRLGYGAEAFKAFMDNGPAPTDDMREYEYAKSQGYEGSFQQFVIDMKKASAPSTNISMGGGKYGTIPQGYELIEGPNGAQMRRIPGGPEDTSAADAEKLGQATVSTNIITSAASRAREAAANRNFGSYGQGVVAGTMPWTDSAEVARQVEVLKAQAKIENLTAMRAASPTGGALGAVSDRENEMLAAKSGALDPSSPTFLRDLDDYELTLLQVVHGPEAGLRIFQQTRQRETQGGGDGWQDIGNGVRIREIP